MSVDGYTVVILIEVHPKCHNIIMVMRLVRLMVCYAEQRWPMLAPLQSTNKKPSLPDLGALGGPKHAAALQKGSHVTSRCALCLESI